MLDVGYQGASAKEQGLCHGQRRRRAEEEATVAGEECL